MLYELLLELKNFFVCHREYGDFAIENGKLVDEHGILENQYIRIIGSVFNDGVYRYDDDIKLTDEKFNGAVWLLAIPQAVLDLAEDIEKWQEKYGDVDSSNMSPYTSESFGGYSYSKGSNENGASGSWQKVFKDRMNPWRKIRI